MFTAVREAIHKGEAINSGAEGHAARCGRADIRIAVS